MRLLVTRPLPDAERTAVALRRHGHQVDIAALLRIESIPAAELDRGPWSALVLTSANALRAIEWHRRRADLLGLRVFAVGPRTAAAARAAGFIDVIEAGGNVQELTQQIGAWAKGQGESPNPLLYLAGQDRSGDPAGDLAVEGLIVATAVVYRAVKMDRFPPAVAVALAARQIDGVLHFSRRSAEAYIDCARTAGLVNRALAPSHYCLSRQIAEPLKATGAKTIRIAASPGESALIERINSGT
jgi:uroporphyrinogen-III synthase